MTRKEQQEEIKHRLKSKPHLIPVFTSTLSIPERLFEYDFNQFIVLNCRTQRYEVHSLYNKGDTLCFAVGCNELDGRVLDIARKTDIRKRKAQEIFDEIDRHNEAVDRDNERIHNDEIGELAERIHKPLREVAYS